MITDWLSSIFFAVSQHREVKNGLITGASLGVGGASAVLFQQKGWNVVATMRAPENDTELGGLANASLVILDVTDSASIEEAAVASGMEKFGSIDVLINNAGWSGHPNLV